MSQKVNLIEVAWLSKGFDIGKQSIFIILIVILIFILVILFFFKLELFL